MGYHREPVLGFPSKKAAIVALFKAGKRSVEIAEMIGSTRGAVDVAIKMARHAGELPPSDKTARSAARAKAEAGQRTEATPGLWTLEKIGKARRLFAKTMPIIAAALQVPVGELLSLLVSGTVPPMGRAGRIGDLRNRHEAAAETEPQTAPPPRQPALPPPPAPEVETETPEPPEPPAVPQQAEIDADNEAQEQIELPARAAKFRLLSVNGRYLHESLDGFTGTLRFAWCGNRRQLKAVLARQPDLKRCKVEPVFA